MDMDVASGTAKDLSSSKALAFDSPPTPTCFSTATASMASLSSFFLTAALSCPHPASISIPLRILGVAVIPNSFSSTFTNSLTFLRPLGPPSKPPVGFNGIKLTCVISRLIPNLFKRCPSCLATSGVSFSFSINAHSRVTLRFVVSIYSRIAIMSSSNPPYLLLAGNNCVLSSSEEQCKLTANLTCISSCINFLIFGTTPTVLTVIFLAPIPKSVFILLIASMTFL
mmetsp:Transcript_12173/g.18242  ORF Transcript_12173/g.18242 Transcript_12173/m.18242 type:complete len:226 (+) Transcript_12173:571-1248(+)